MGLERGMHIELEKALREANVIAFCFSPIRLDPVIDVLLNIQSFPAFRLQSRARVRRTVHIGAGGILSWLQGRERPCSQAKRGNVKECLEHTACKGTTDEENVCFDYHRSTKR